MFLQILGLVVFSVKCEPSPDFLGKALDGGGDGGVGSEGV
jgi:hypothetical protein